MFWILLLVNNKEIIFVNTYNNWYSVEDKITLLPFDKKDLYATCGDAFTQDLVVKEKIIVS